MQVSNTNRGFAPTTLAEAVQFSEMLASSSMVPRAYQGKPQDVLVCVQWGYEMGRAPVPYTHLTLPTNHDRYTAGVHGA